MNTHTTYSFVLMVQGRLHSLIAKNWYIENEHDLNTTARAFHIMATRFKPTAKVLVYKMETPTTGKYCGGFPNSIRFQAFPTTIDFTKNFLK